MNLCDRLKSERERLGYSQTAFAAVANASKHAQINWEKGVATPNAAALVAWADVGLDVLYLVTGVPTEAHAVLDSIQTATKVAHAVGGSDELRDALYFQLQEFKLTPEERELIEAFRKASPSVQKAAMAALLSSNE